MGPEKPAGQIRIIGLDGATWDVLLPWIEAGKLPNFFRVLREGSWGPLRSLPGSLSPVMWTSIATGYERDKHGIEGFQVRNGYGMRLVRSSDRKVPAIWNLASQYGLKTYIVNWQVTDPPEAINGVMVSRLRELGETGVYPLELTEELAAITGAVRLPPTAQEDSVQRWRRVLREDLEKLIAIERFLTSRGRPDLAGYYTHSTDEVQHRYWKYMEPDVFIDPLLRPSPDDVKEHGNAIFEVYQRIDDWIGESWSPEEEILVLVSDHGAQADPQPRVYLALNPLLAALGLAEVTESGEVITEASQAFNCTEDPWSFHLTICLNLVGREPNGIVPLEKATALSQNIAQRLTALRLTDHTALIKSAEPSADGTSVRVEAIRPSRLQFEDELQIQGRMARLRDYLIIHDISGQHSSFGILAIAGGPVVVGRIHNADLLDVAPTILYLLGQPVAEDMEGSPLTEIVEPRYLEEHPVYRTRSFDPLAVQDEASPVSGREDEAQRELKERLRSLGYIQ
jgi:predicted AlkP superfamily phosphohydrolase/phosphomutase